MTLPANDSVGGSAQLFTQEDVELVRSESSKYSSYMGEDVPIVAALRYLASRIETTLAVAPAAVPEQTPMTINEWRVNADLHDIGRAADLATVCANCGCVYGEHFGPACPNGDGSFSSPTTAEEKGKEPNRAPTDSLAGSDPEIEKALDRCRKAWRDEVYASLNDARALEQPGTIKELTDAWAAADAARAHVLELFAAERLRAENAEAKVEAYDRILRRAATPPVLPPRLLRKER